MLRNPKKQHIERESATQDRQIDECLDAPPYSIHLRTLKQEARGRPKPLYRLN